MQWQDVQRDVIGERAAIDTPFGERPLVYADYTASGRAYAPIENFIRDRVLPYYANTHSESSLTGRQTNQLREQARQAIRDSVNAGDEHAVIFCGSGATAAIHRLIDLLGIAQSAEETVVLLGPYEHHSNLLPWRESGARVVELPLDAGGGLDLKALEDALQRYQGVGRLLASFSAASNVTGRLTDTRRIGELVRRYGGAVFWDYAAAAPYVAMDASDKDALFISPHKFLGGPGTPGILVVRRSLVARDEPTHPGGGTVSFVSPQGQRYLQDLERREEEGTPAIVEAVRAGLVFKLRDSIGIEVIEARERALVERALARLQAIPGLRLLGNPQAPRLSIVAFQLDGEYGQLHYGYVVALLNDLFGIQARGGCSCAGPYGHHLLGIDAEASEAFDAAIGAGESVLRPGWVRLNFNYFVDDDSVDYILDAIELIAREGARLLPHYRYDPVSGTWLFGGEAQPLPVSLDDFSPELGDNRAPRVCRSPLTAVLAQARKILSDPAGAVVVENPLQDARYETLRWFALPAAAELASHHEGANVCDSRITS